MMTIATRSISIRKCFAFFYALAIVVRAENERGEEMNIRNRVFRRAAAVVITAAFLVTSVMSSVGAFGPCEVRALTGDLSQLGEVSVIGEVTCVEVKDDVTLSGDIVIDSGEKLVVTGIEAKNVKITAAPGKSVFVVRGSGDLCLGSRGGDVPMTFKGGSVAGVGSPVVDASGASEHGAITVDDGIVLSGGDGQVPADAIIYPADVSSRPVINITGELKKGETTGTPGGDTGVIPDPGDPGNTGSGSGGIGNTDQGNSGAGVNDPGSTESGNISQDNQNSPGGGVLQVQVRPAEIQSA